MANIKTAYDEVRIPFSKMSFTPDVPSAALTPNEYNSGLNVEADVRGIRSVAGDQNILSSVPGTPTYISGGFRQGNQYWFIVATDEGYWYASNGGASPSWTNITPGGGPFSGYTQSLSISETWNGTIPFFNDTINPPMFWPDEPNAIMVLYSNEQPANINNIVYVNTTTQQIQLSNSFNSTGSSISGTVLTIGTITSADTVNQVPAIGQYLVGTGIPEGTTIIGNISGAGNGSKWRISTSLTVASTEIDGSPFVAAPYMAGDSITITNVSNYYNGTFTVVSSTATTINYTASPNASYPGQGTGTVSPTYSWNYNPNWISVSAGFMRMYDTPNVGAILVAGNLTAVDINGNTLNYPVTIQWSQAFALNSAPLTWTPTVTNIANQLEIPLRAQAVDGFPSNGNFFICSYWDTVVFNPINYSTTSAPILGVQLYNKGRGLLSDNCYAITDSKVYGLDARDIWVFDGTSFTGIGNQRVKNWFYDQLDPRYYRRVYMKANTQKNQIEIYYPDRSATNGVPNKMLSYRFDIDCWNAPREVYNATFACETPIWTYDANVWVAHNSTRTIAYAQGQTNSYVVQKDQGYTHPDGTAISSSFTRDNIKMAPNYSTSILVHRILPEAFNIGTVPFTGTNELQIVPSTGNISVTISGTNSVGSSPTTENTVVLPLNTDSPWIQVNQNQFRVNGITLSNSSNNSCWMCTATTWQYTEVTDDR